MRYKASSSRDFQQLLPGEKLPEGHRLKCKSLALNSKMAASYLISILNRLSWTKSIPSRLVLKSFSGATSGALRVETVDGETITLGDMESTERTPSITIHNDLFWARVLFFGDVGFAESYILHEISSDDLKAVFEFFIGNSSAINKPAAAGLWPWLFGKPFRAILGSRNDIRNAQKNTKAHYSQSNEMFSSFLSPDMTYSAPIWLPKSDPGYQTETLEQAQLRKLEYALRQTRVQASDHVLEIGTGWGSFAIIAARTTGCRVTTVTLSNEQKQLAEERIRDADVGGRVEVLEVDYRELDGLGSFDKIVSIEMIEHVGHDFLGSFFECMDRYLKVDGGIGYFQCITIPETRYERYCRGEDFIKKYIFPGGHLPTVSGLVAGINRGSRGKLIVEEIKSIGAHYPRALRSWRETFLANFEPRVVPALRKSRPEMTVAEMELFRRQWEVSKRAQISVRPRLTGLAQYYFSYCEAGFKTKSLGNVGITVGRENCVALLEDP